MSAKSCPRAAVRRGYVNPFKLPRVWVWGHVLLVARWRHRLLRDLN